ncbi:hypothetical protein [Dongshaea marina]|nr:hypothetical protein [Dongshaea marina]
MSTVFHDDYEMSYFNYSQQIKAQKESGKKEQEAELNWPQPQQEAA